MDKITAVKGNINSILLSYQRTKPSRDREGLLYCWDSCI